MTTIHFVYVGSAQNNKRYAPYTISKHVHQYLNKRIPTRFYDWCSSNLPKIGKNDIILGHPNYGDNTIVRRMFSEAKCRAKCLIHPLHTRMPEYNFPFDDLARQADQIFSICGPYWYNTMEDTKFAHWKPKIIRLDMAIDVSQFPFVRKSFNPPGKRNLLYIGKESPEKGTNVLYEIVKRCPDVDFYWFGAMQSGSPFKSLPNAKIIGWADFTPQFVADLATKADLFLNTSISDANPTTLLEAAAWGFIPFCTDQSGYYGDDARCDNMFVKLDLDNIDFNISAIQRYNRAPGHDLMTKARNSRKVVEQKYTWNRFCETIWNGLQRFL